MADDTELPDFDVPVGLFQDVEDLKAEVARLTAQAKGLAEADAAGAGEASAGDDRRPADRPKTARKETNEFPPFILLLDSPQYGNELRALIEWVVEGVLVLGYLAETSTDARWCQLWFEHPAAIARRFGPASTGRTWGTSRGWRQRADRSDSAVSRSTGSRARGSPRNEWAPRHAQPHGQIAPEPVAR
ncbi:DUF4913 domain-containing protein [Streptomyces gardneri]|uniref:DUF4913 domain-containing protein n=1 Tax=Streptomyces gardneri TaxID=66892 RepID=UPI003F4CE795